MNFVPKERSKKTIKRLLEKHERESRERAAERRRKYLLEKYAEQ